MFPPRHFFQVVVSEVGMSDEVTTSTEREQTMKMQRVQTTLGDLIFAISEAARETAVQEEDLAELTKYILDHMLNSSRSGK